MFLWKVLSRSFKAECAVLLFNHFKDPNGVSICQPYDKRPAATSEIVIPKFNLISNFKIQSQVKIFVWIR